MIFIPRKWTPYLLIILGVLGVFVGVTKGVGGDKVFGIIVCVLVIIGGAVWAFIDRRNK